MKTILSKVKTAVGFTISDFKLYLSISVINTVAGESAQCIGALTILNEDLSLLSTPTDA